MACDVNEQIDRFVKGLPALFIGALVAFDSDFIYQEVLNFVDIFREFVLRRVCMNSTFKSVAAAFSRNFP